MAAEHEPTGTFTIAFAEGVALSKWTTVWAQRRPDVALAFERTDAASQSSVLREGIADVSFVRLPVDRAELSVIPLYSETPVVVVPKDHEITLLEVVPVAELVDEHLLQDEDEVPEWRDAAAASRTAPRRPRPEIDDIADAFELVAAGVGILILPQSVARAHQRKDLTFRPVEGVAETQIALAWLEERFTPEIEEFVGIVRGRSAHSSRELLTGVGAPRPETGTTSEAAGPASGQGSTRASGKAPKGSGPTGSSTKVAGSKASGAQGEGRSRSKAAAGDTPGQSPRGSGYAKASAQWTKKVGDKKKAVAKGAKKYRARKMRPGK